MPPDDQQERDKYLRESWYPEQRMETPACYATGDEYEINTTDLSSDYRSYKRMKRILKGAGNRPFHCPPWLSPSDVEVVVPGTGQRWHIRSAEWRAVAGEAQILNLELFSTGEMGTDGAREKALAEAPDDVRTCLEALYDLEDSLPPDKEAIVEICADDPARFDVRVVDRNSQ